MEKKHAFIFAFLITSIITINFFVFSSLSKKEDFREEVIIERVVDGDTVVLDDGLKVRLININAPETGEFMSAEAKDFLENYVNQSVEVEIAGLDRYGRSLGVFYYSNFNINLELVKKGLAHIYLAREEYLDELINAQENARKKEIGIWKKSKYSGCLNTEINKNKEYLVIEDNCELNFKDWSIKDEGWRSYKFKKEIDAKKITFYSGNGEDSQFEIYWNQDEREVWNKEKNSLFIRDEEGGIVYYSNYGY